MGQTLRTRRRRRYERLCAERLDRSRSTVMRMLEPFDDVPGFAPLKEILLRPFNSIHAVDLIFDILFRGPGIPSFTKHQECYEIYIFHAMVHYMTPEERTSHMALLVVMFKRLTEQHERLTKCSGHGSSLVAKLVTHCVEAARGVEGPSGKEVVGFVEYVMRTIRWDGLFVYMKPNDVDYILTCFSNERHHACGIREGSFLMHQLTMINDLDKMRSAVLIRNGFKYYFHTGYYKSCCYTLIDEGIFKGQPSNIFHAMVKAGNLRMQMALEILVYLHDDGRRSRELLYTLWQSLPVPFITSDDLYHLTEPFLVPGRGLDLFARYRELFPGLPRENQPRSLKHLARVRIREIMVRAHTIGERAVRSLGLPEAFEDYLWKLEEF